MTSAGPERSPVAAVSDLAAARDRALVRRLECRDARAAEALATLFQAYAPVAVGLARRVTRQDQLAEDVVQEAFLGLWTSPQAYDSGRGTVRGYLLTVVHHRAVDAVRREETQRLRGDRDAADPVPAARDIAEEVTDLAEHAQRGRAVSAALAGLPTEQRLIVELMYFDGKTQQTIADELHVPLGTVKSRALLAMRRLRSALAGQVCGGVS